MSKKLLFSAGDLSGDIHSARLAREVLRRHPDWKIYALGGAHLKAAGAEIIGDTSDLGVIGYVSALAVTPRSLLLRRGAVQFLKKHRVDAAVLCDWGGFNTRFIPQLNRLKVPTLYYFPPRSWQRTGNGGLAIAPLVSRIATPFEWSATRLKNSGARAEWVGHPLLEIVEEIRKANSREATRAEFGVEKGRQLIAIFPGSRATELQVIAPRVAGAMKLLEEKFSGNLRFVVVVPTGARERVQAHFPDVRVCENRSTEILVACDAAIVKSGTITLEAAVANAPQIVVYDVSPVVYAQIRLTGLQKKVPFVAMPNIILGRMAVPELLGVLCRPQPIADALSKLVEDPSARSAMRREYTHVREALGANLPYTATHRTAEILEEMLTVTMKDER